MGELIARISEGLGNQLFQYAFGYSLSKNINYSLFLDNKSGYFKKKNQIRSFELDKFHIYAKLSENKYRFDNHLLDVKRKFLKIIDHYKSNKSFLIENKTINKLTSFQNYSNKMFSSLLFLEGNFESEKYFIEYSKDINDQFSIQKKYIDANNKYLDILNKTNSISICIRQHRYSERGFSNVKKSDEFTKNTIIYVKKAVEYFKNIYPETKFFIWSNDFKNLGNYFNTEEFTFVDNHSNKTINDFYLFKYCKNFIVGPTTFHWWGAWLNNNPNKICTRPSNLNPSNNKDFWPNNWISI